MTKCDKHKDTGECCCISVELTIERQSCVNPFDYLAEKYANSLTPFEDLIQDLDDKIIIEDSENICCPACGEYYVLSSVETALKFAEAIGWTGLDPVKWDCTGNVYASVETWVKYGEALAWTQSSSTGFPIGNVLPIDNNFTELVMNFLYSLIAPTDIYILPNPGAGITQIVDTGITEFGSLKSNNCSSMSNFFNMVLQFKDQYSSPINVLDKLRILLDKGIVVDCPEIVGVETYLKSLEAVG